VCDGYGEVFGHPGLFLADGSVMPGPVGPNPSLTIAALADRMSTRILETRETPPRAATPAVEKASSLSFDEQMAGSVVLGATDPRTTEPTDQAERLSFRLTISVDDVAAFLTRPDHLARADGWVEADCLGGRLPVERGWFNLFEPGDAERSRVMRYRLWFTDGDGEARTLCGWKDVHEGPATQVWHDTTTLYTRLLRGHVPPGEDADEVDAAGTLHIGPTELAAMLSSVRAEGPEPAAALAGFGKFFMGELWEVYGPG
jgi:cholesterol oxidase